MKEYNMENLGSLTLPVIFSPEASVLKTGIPLSGLHLPNGDSTRTSGVGSGFAPNYSLLCLLSRLSCGKFICSCLPTCTVLTALFFTLLLGKNYVKYCLLWLDTQEEWIVCTMFILLYTAVSFPLTWGYILLNLACGYHFGLIAGMIVTALAACIGITLAHLLMKQYFVGLIAAKLIRMNILQSTLSILDGAHAFKVIAVSRLTPIPFGLQNAVFAVSPIHLRRYVGASAVGLLPTQVINVYLGTTVRSMEDVLEDDATASMGYAILLIQIILSIALMALIVRYARQELKKTVSEELHEVTQNGSSPKNPLLKQKCDFKYHNNQWPYNWRTAKNNLLILNRV